MMNFLLLGFDRKLVVLLWEEVRTSVRTWRWLELVWLEGFCVSWGKELGMWGRYCLVD